MAMVAAALSAQLYDTAETAAVTRSGQTGGALGLALGLAAGIWLVLRDGGRQAGPALAWLWVGVLMLAVCLGYVAFSR